MDIDSTRWLKLRSGSDIRSRENDLTDEICARVGYAYARMLADRLRTTPDTLTVAVGCDARPSGQRIKAALSRGITAADSDVVDGGLCALPALFMRVSQGAKPGSVHGAVMVTGGDAAEEVNGFKFITAAGGLTDADVATLLRMAAADPVPERLVTRAQFMGDYRDYLLKRAAELLKDDALKPLLGLYVVVDTATLGGAFFAKLLEDLGADVERLEDGDLAEAVPRFEADMGFAFDGDCSRAWLFDAQGRAVDGNRLIAVVAAMLLEERPGLTFVTDSVTSTGLSAFIAEWGGVHYRFKRGYRNVIREAIRLNDEAIDCPLAIETTGHAAFRENGFLDDGIYLALRVACWALDCKREGKTVFDPLADLSEAVEARTLRLRILDEEDPAASSQEAVEIILSHTLEDPEWQMAQDSREGVRITFNLDGGVKNAWLQLRMSVHDPVMVLHAESDIPGGVRRVLGELYALIKDTELLDLTPLKEAVE
ncbi:MAG: hypothetical protein IJ646_07470 [Clostridia bacterium]|nr:hypothetical protein [Clostridia bacterium]